MSITGLIIDDHKLFADGFGGLLQRLARFSQLDMVYTMADGMKQVSARQYNYIFTDIKMPDMNEHRFVQHCKRTQPYACIIVVSSVTDMSVVRTMLQLGVDAYLNKAVDSKEILLAMEKTAAGEKYVSTDLIGKFASGLSQEYHMHLTPKEIEVIRMVAAGKTIEETAVAIHVSRHTVIAHRRNIMKKLNLRSAAEIVKYAYEHRLV